MSQGVFNNYRRIWLGFRVNKMHLKYLGDLEDILSGWGRA
jgi:hypothetical protein